MRRAQAKIRERADKDRTQNKNEKAFDWSGDHATWAPIGGVGAFENARDQERHMIQELEDRIADIRDEDGGMSNLNRKLIDQMRKEIAKFRLKNMKSQWDTSYEECFKKWMAGTQRTLNDPRISPLGYRHLGQQFPRATRWAEAQLDIQMTIHRYLVRLYLKGPTTEKEVEHYFRYLIWPMNMALRELQRIRRTDDVKVDDLAISDTGIWQPPNDTEDRLVRSPGRLYGVAVDEKRYTHLWPESLTWKGRAYAKQSGIPLALSPALNPYMRDQYFTSSISYGDWIQRDFSRLNGDAKELWEYAALRIDGQDDQMQDAMAPEAAAEAARISVDYPSDGTPVRTDLARTRTEKADVCRPSTSALYKAVRAPVPVAVPEAPAGERVEETGPEAAGGEEEEEEDDDEEEGGKNNDSNNKDDDDGNDNDGADADNDNGDGDNDDDGSNSNDDETEEIDDPDEELQEFLNVLARDATVESEQKLLDAAIASKDAGRILEARHRVNLARAASGIEELRDPESKISVTIEQRVTRKVEKTYAADAAVTLEMTKQRTASSIKRAVAEPVVSEAIASAVIQSSVKRDSTFAVKARAEIESSKERAVTWSATAKALLSKETLRDIKHSATATAELLLTRSVSVEETKRELDAALSGSEAVSDDVKQATATVAAAVLSERDLRAKKRAEAKVNREARRREQKQRDRQEAIDAWNQSRPARAAEEADREAARKAAADKEAAKEAAAREAKKEEEARKAAADKEAKRRAAAEEADKAREDAQKMDDATDTESDDDDSDDAESDDDDDAPPAAVSDSTFKQRRAMFTGSLSQKVLDYKKGGVSPLDEMKMEDFAKKFEEEKIASSGGVSSEKFKKITGLDARSIFPSNKKSLSVSAGNALRQIYNEYLRARETEG